MNKMKIGILRETKNPPDRRVPLTPTQCAALREQYPHTEWVVQPSKQRCYSDREYEKAGISLQEDLSDADLLMGVKEVDTTTLLDGKTYLFFSHTAKKQPYNRVLLQEIIHRGITLVDYEYLVREDHTRVVAFGHWAGVVGAYNGLRAYGLRNGRFDLVPAHELSGQHDMKAQLSDLPLEGVRICLTGGGRGAGGAVKIMEMAGIPEAAPEAYMKGNEDGPVYTRLDPWHYTRRKDDGPFSFDHFVAHPEAYTGTFLPYARQTDLFVACHYWDPRSPVFFTPEEMLHEDFRISVVADISCDIKDPIPSTVRPSTIAEPFYGYSPVTDTESPNIFDTDVVTVMAVDNLPGELPRDASEDFGKALVTSVIPSLTGDGDRALIDRATIAAGGKLTPTFAYLEDYLLGKD